MRPEGNQTAISPHPRRISPAGHRLRSGARAGRTRGEFGWSLLGRRMRRRSTALTSAMSGEQQKTLLAGHAGCECYRPNFLAFFSLRRSRLPPFMVTAKERMPITSRASPPRRRKDRRLIRHGDQLRERRVRPVGSHQPSPLLTGCTCLMICSSLFENIPQATQTLTGFNQWPHTARTETPGTR